MMRGLQQAHPFELAIDGSPVRDFDMPPGVETRLVDPKTGLLAMPGQPDALDEVFLAGTAPTEVVTPEDRGRPAEWSDDQAP